MNRRWWFPWCGVDHTEAKTALEKIKARDPEIAELGHRLRQHERINHFSGAVQEVLRQVRTTPHG